jgi:predicted DNA-binding protein (UPF0251 family)
MELNEFETLRLVGIHHVGQRDDAGQVQNIHPEVHG